MDLVTQVIPTDDILQQMSSDDCSRMPIPNVFEDVAPKKNYSRGLKSANVDRAIAQEQAREADLAACQKFYSVSSEIRLKRAIAYIKLYKYKESGQAPMPKVPSHLRHLEKDYELCQEERKYAKVCCLYFFRKI